MPDELFYVLSFYDQVVYMDEPSAGLDPASRNFLWNVVKNSKQGRAIILTSKYIKAFLDCRI